MNIIALDFGASFIKGSFLHNGVIVQQAQSRAPSVSKKDILIPKQISSMLPMVKKVIKELAGEEKELWLGISNEMHGFLLAYNDGTPFTDYISWQNELGGVAINGVTAKELMERDTPIRHIKKTGMPMRAGLPSCNLRYLKESGILTQAQGPLIFYTLGDYLLRILSGHNPSIHLTNAAASGFCDIVTGSWNPVLIENAGGGNISFLSIGEDILTFQLDGITVHAAPAIGDQQAALLGAGLNDENTLSFNLGTGAQVSMLIKHFEQDGSYQLRPFFDGAYIKTIPHIPSGRALNVYVRFFQEILSQFGVQVGDAKIWQCILEAEKTATDTGLFCDMSFFENAVTNHTKGTISNIGEYELTLGNLIHSIFLQMAENFIYCADKIYPASFKIQQILFSGGIGRKIERIRSYILEHYPQVTKVIVAENETLIGLDCYIHRLQNKAL